MFIQELERRARRKHHTPAAANAVKPHDTRAARADMDGPELGRPREPSNHTRRPPSRPRRCATGFARFGSTRSDHRWRASMGTS